VLTSLCNNISQLSRITHPLVVIQPYAKNPNLLLCSQLGMQINNIEQYVYYLLHIRSNKSSVEIGNVVLRQQAWRVDVAQLGRWTGRWLAIACHGEER